jgi:four helix bundle protein
MVYEFSYEKMRMWTDVRKYIKSVYEITNTFPTDEKFGLTQQLRRASVSVLSNIAEGLSRKTQKEKQRFIEISYGSLMETNAQWIISLDLFYIDNEQYKTLKREVLKISNQLNALAKSLQESNDST